MPPPIYNHHDLPWQRLKELLPTSKQQVPPPPPPPPTVKLVSGVDAPLVGKVSFVKNVSTCSLKSQEEERKKESLVSTFQVNSYCIHSCTHMHYNTAQANCPWHMVTCLNISLTDPIAIIHFATFGCNSSIELSAQCPVASIEARSMHE